MSNELLNRAWGVKGITAVQKLLLTRLADRADKNGLCHPGYTSLARDCCITTRKIGVNIKALVTAGHLEIVAAASFDRAPTYKVTPKVTPEPGSGGELPGGDVPNQIHQMSRTGFAQTIIEPTVNPQLPGLASPAGGECLLLGLDRADQNPAPPKRTRQRNQIFEAIVEVCRMDPQSVTGTAGSLIGRVVKEIRQVCAEVTPDMIRRVAANYRAAWPDADLTPAALVKHWARFVTGNPAVEIPQLNAELIKHPGNPRAAIFHVDNLTPEIANDFKVKSERLKQLKLTCQIL